jgi:hypothetical protein
MERAHVAQIGEREHEFTMMFIAASMSFVAFLLLAM